MYTKQELNRRHRAKLKLKKLALSCPESERPLADLPYGWTQEMYNNRFTRLVASRSAYGRGKNLENSAGYSLINSIIELIKQTTYSPRDKIKIVFNMTAQLINACDIKSSKLKSWAELTTNYNFDKEDTKHLADILHSQLTPAQIEYLTSYLIEAIRKDADLWKSIMDYFPGRKE